MKTVKFLLMALAATAFVGCSSSDDDSASTPKLATPTPTVDQSTVTTTSATVTWSAVTNAASYEVQLDGATVQTVTSPSVSLTSLTAGTTYTVGVRAVPSDTQSYQASNFGTCSLTTLSEGGEGGEGGNTAASLSGSNYYLISLDATTYETIKDKVVADFRPNELDSFLYDWAGGFTGGTCAGPNFYGVVDSWVNMSINTGLGWFGAGFFSTNVDNIKKLAQIDADVDNYYLHMAWKGNNTGNYAVKLYDGVIDGCPVIVDVDGEYGFTRDGEWHEIEVPIKYFYNKGLKYQESVLGSLTPDGSGNVGLNIMAITQPDDGTMPQSLQIDAVFIYKK